MFKKSHWESKIRWSSNIVKNIIHIIELIQEPDINLYRLLGDMNILVTVRWISDPMSLNHRTVSWLIVPTICNAHRKQESFDDFITIIEISRNTPPLRNIAIHSHLTIDQELSINRIRLRIIITVTRGCNQKIYLYHLLAQNWDNQPKQPNWRNYESMVHRRLRKSRIIHIIE